MKGVDLSIVIVTWNRRTLVENCLRSVSKHTQQIDYEIIVVDNGSGDGTVDMIREVFPEVRLLASRENLGFARGNNLGIRESRGRYVVLLNNDTLLKENAFQKLVFFMDEHPEAGAVGPLLLSPDGTVQDSALQTFINIPSALLGGEYMVRFLQRFVPFLRLVPEMVIPSVSSDRAHEVAWLVGACVLVRREVVEKAGLLDENLFMYGEDMEWCYRIRKTGAAVFFLPQAKVIHLDHVPTKAAMKDVVGQQMAHQVYFFRKHKGRLAAGCLSAALFTGSLLKLPGFVLLYLLSICSPGKREARLKFKVSFHYHAIRYFFSRALSRTAGKGPPVDGRIRP